MHPTPYPTLISYAQAIEILNSIPLPPLGTQQVHFKDSLHRILAQDIYAPHNVPAHPTATMDGYAIAFSDLALLFSQGLELLAPNKAGNPTIPTLPKGYAIKTFTGSAMPLDSDTLIIIEHTEIKNGRLFVKTHANTPTAQEIKPYQWVRQVGDNYKQGEILLHKGDKITPFEIGLFAELNLSFVQVYQRVRVGVICIGDEIVEVGENSPHSNTIRSVNAHLLESLLIQMGQEPIVYPLLKDDKNLIESTYAQALQECDLVLSAGGMSMGDYDYTQEVIQNLLEMQFKGVRLKPGKPVSFGIAPHPTRPKLALGLPGFPNSCAITFLLFGSILLARLQGRSFTPQILNATLLENIKRTDSRLEFRTCDISLDNGTLNASFKSKKSLQSSMINNLTRNTALAILEENGGDLQAGEQIQILFLNHF